MIEFNAALPSGIVDDKLESPGNGSSFVNAAGGDLLLGIQQHQPGDEVDDHNRLVHVRRFQPPRHHRRVRISAVNISSFGSRVADSLPQRRLRAITPRTIPGAVRPIAARRRYRPARSRCWIS